MLTEQWIIQVEIRTKWDWVIHCMFCPASPGNSDSKDHALSLRTRAVKRVPETAFWPQNNPLESLTLRWSYLVFILTFSLKYILNIFDILSHDVSIFSFFSLYLTTNLKNDTNISASFQADHCMLLYQIGFCQGSLFVAENPGLKWVFTFQNCSRFRYGIKESLLQSR